MRIELEFRLFTPQCPAWKHLQLAIDLFPFTGNGPCVATVNCFSIPSHPDANFLGIYSSIGLVTELHNAEGIHLTSTLDRAVVEISHNPLHGIGFDAHAGTITCERSLNCAVCINEVGVVMFNYSSILIFVFTHFINNF